MASTETEFDCEEVLLPEPNTNGETGEDEVRDIEFLDEHDPMSEVVGTANEETILGGDGEEVAEGNGEETEDAEEGDEDEEAEDIEEADRDGDGDGDGEADADGAAEIKAEGEGEDEDEEDTTMNEKENTDSTVTAGKAGNILPKKRKDPTNSEIPETTNDEEEEPASTSRAAAAKADNQVDEDQCRVCTTKVDLVSLFKKVENEQTVADMLMMICPTVSIALKDFMPQFICNPCLDNVTIAVQLKTQCETTERELRKKLSRSKNKVRRPAMGYVTIDAPIDSDPSDDDEEPNDDVEFKVSEEESASADDDSEDSDFSGKRRVSRGGIGRGRRRPAPAVSSFSIKKEKFGKRPFGDHISEDIRKKRKKPTNSEPALTEFACDECDEVFNRKLSLVLHKKSHVNERSMISCEVCGKQFKIHGAYRTHLQKHREEPTGFPCDKCEEVYATNADLKRHLAEDHDQPGMVHACKKCQRTFIAASRLYKHTLRCPGYPLKNKRSEFDGPVVGQDLFKTVAPLQTTYWSDSFSD